MNKINTLDELRRLRESLKTQVVLREQGEHSDQLIQIQVGMATCGIAAGAKQVMEKIIEELDKHAVNAVVTQTGCMGFCYAEPTVQVTLPGKESVVFGEVDNDRVIDIIEKYIMDGELIDGIIPLNYKTIENKD
jgi:NADP-reducing hydrogenase subunit HndB